MKRATLDAPLEASGLNNYWGLTGGTASIRFSPLEEGCGVCFTDPKTGALVEMNDQNVEAHKNFIGARFLRAQVGETRLNVVEHLMAALIMAGISDVRVDFLTKMPLNFVPVIGPGLEPLYTKLQDARTELTEELPNFRVKTAKEFSTDNAMLRVTPSESLGFSTEAFLDDVVDFNPQGIHIKNLVTESVKHVKARPIARAQSPLARFMKLTIGRFLYGIASDTYVMALHRDTADDVVAKMHPQYQDGRNEHFFHTAVADFPPELYVRFPGSVQGDFAFKGKANHITRMNLLGQVKDSDIMERS